MDGAQVLASVHGAVYQNSGKVCPVEIGRGLGVRARYSVIKLEPLCELPPDWLGHDGNGIGGDGTCRLD
jgi:hypothetical protein